VRLVAVENNVNTARREQRLARGTKLSVGWLPEHGRVMRT
jgi:hypothetical protein